MHLAASAFVPRSDEPIVIDGRTVMASASRPQLCIVVRGAFVFASPCSFCESTRLVHFRHLSRLLLRVYRLRYLLLFRVACRPSRVPMCLKITH